MEMKVCESYMLHIPGGAGETDTTAPYETPGFQSARVYDTPQLPTLYEEI